MTVRTAIDHASWNVYQASYQRLRDVLHNAVTHAAHTSSDARDGVGSLGWRMVGALDSLLAAHPVDRRGRCQSCRRSRFWKRHQRVCMVFQQAHYWLRQPAEQLPDHLSVSGTGRPDLDHGGAGVRTPDCSWLRRVPPAGPSESLLCSGGVAWPR